MERKANAMKTGVQWSTEQPARTNANTEGRKERREAVFVSVAVVLAWHARHRFLDVACLPKGLIFDFIQKATRGREIDDKIREREEIKRKLVQ